MNIHDLVATIGAANYLAVALLVTVYVRKLVSPGSAFPITISPNWRPTVTAAAGLVYAVLTALRAGSTWGAAALVGAVAAGSSGFLDGLLSAIFGAPENAPSWAKAFVFIFDDVTGGSSSSSGGDGGGNDGGGGNGRGGDGGAGAVDMADRPTVPDARFARAAKVPPVLAGAVVALGVSLAGCAKSATVPPRELARAEVLTLDEAVRVVGAICADSARDAQSPELAKRCDDGLARARAGLAAATATIDAYDAGHAGDVACAARDALDGLDAVATALDGVRIEIPPAVTDALVLARALAGVCRA